ncbi:MAG: CDP-alcohol phosphatidyltransferase family protein [Alphaproteobacteria bacterium]
MDDSLVDPSNPSALPDTYLATLGHLPAAGVAAVALAGVMTALFGLGAGPPVAALVLFVLLAGLVVATTALPHGEFGAGNRITLARIIMVCLVGSALGAPAAALDDRMLWLLIPIAVIAALLDALDGQVARATGTVSAFGARLDMEADALFILILSALLWHIDKVGAWVIASGLARYAFVASGLALPSLRMPLSPSRRRQTVCVVQVVALIVALAPLVPALAASLIAAAALALLSWSFAIDIAWLLRRRDATPPGDAAP